MRINEWGDPYPILDADRSPTTEKHLRRELEQAAADSFESQHRTTRLDTGSRFVLQAYERTVAECEARVPDPLEKSEMYRVRVRRFWRGRPAGVRTGVVVRTGDSWTMYYDRRESLLTRLKRWFFQREPR